jgi:threonyl-tRNA synthetase
MLHKINPLFTSGDTIMSGASSGTEDHELGREAFADEREYRLHSLRHSAAHVLAQAVLELYPGAKLGNGPPVKDGFYYDIHLEHPLTPDDVKRIEERMHEICKRNLPIVRKVLSRDEAVEVFKARHQDFKVERVSLIPAGEEVSTFTQGDFVDLCRGPHVMRTGDCKHVRLTSVAGAYWLGDPNNPQMQRIYGTAWPTAKELEEHLHRVEEAKQRDHRKLGKELGLFMFHEWAPGSTFWLPKGTVLYNTLAQKMRELLLDNGYVEVKTPLLFDAELWRTSGHWFHYKDNMFCVNVDTTEHAQSEAEKARKAEHATVREYALKPMNCPSHMLIFRSEKRSYRELPLRLHDQGVLHRNELSGALGGLTRVRQFSQDDAHIFLPESEIGPEVFRLISLVKRVYDKLGMTVDVALATRPESFLGEVETWDRAEAALKEAIQAAGFPLKLKDKDGTFYGPKIDYQVTDALGRQFQTATLQLDYQLPRQFDLKYVGADNQEHAPVVIHRAIYGSFERFIAILIEHYGGAFPLWLAPVQCRVLTVGAQFAAYAEEVARALRAKGLRVELDTGEGTVGNKVRLSQVEKIPYAMMIGAREVEARTVTLRQYGKKDQQSLSLDEAVARLGAEADFHF